jgi:dUTP pyrophosphatase
MTKEKIISDIRKLKETISELNLLTDNNSNTDTKKMLDNLGVDFEDIKNIQTSPLPKKPTITINFINESNNQDPDYFHEGDSGFDFRANLSDDEIVVIKPMERKLIPTGLYFEVPRGYELQVRPRSGLALKNGITVLNTPGTVDSNYRGEVKIILINLGNEDFTVNSGDRIAQGVISPVLDKMWGELNKVSVLNKSNREKGGFGSTGIK